MAKEALSNFFFLCTIINMVLLLVSTLALSTFGGAIYKLHSKYFPLKEQQFRSIMYSALVGYKLLILVFAAVPWLVLRFF